MNDESPLAFHLQVMLVNEQGSGRVAVDLDPFIEYNGWMNRRLRELERRWASAATPASVRGRGISRRRPRRPK